MKKKHKITLLVIGILLALSLMLSSSYALWVFNVSQESTNVLVSDCFEITFSDNNSIGLSASFPMRDGKGVQTTPYTFTIRNICNHPADFQINLETLNISTIDEEFITADLNGHITEYNAAESVEPTIDGAKSAAMLYEDTLAVNGEKTYNLRIWVNETATQDDVENKTYASKVSVKATVRKQFAEGTLIWGQEFNVALKTLAGDSNPKYNSYNDSITSIERSLTAPTEEDNAVNLAVEGTTTPIYAWFKDGIIYIYTTLDKIYMNSNSANMFYKMRGVTSLDLSVFDTSNVTNMGHMFDGLWSITLLDVSHFDTSNVTNMAFMFEGMSKLTNLDLSNFNTSKVTSMAGMFEEMSNLTTLDVSNFNTSNVTDMNHMFYGMSKLTNLDVSHFDTSKVTTMSYMFSGLRKLTLLDVSNFDTSKVTNMSYMFEGVSGLTSLDVRNFDTSKVTNMGGMFKDTHHLNIIDVSSFNTSNVTNMQRMFGPSGTAGLGHCVYETKSIIGLENFDTSKVTNMSSMFSGLCKLVELNLSNFDTSKVTDMSYMFYGNHVLEHIYVSDLWNTSKINSSDSMLKDIYNIKGGAGTTYDSNHINAEYARVDDPANGKPGYFTYKSA